MDLFRSEYGFQGAVGFISCHDPTSDFFHCLLLRLPIYAGMERFIKWKYKLNIHSSMHRLGILRVQPTRWNISQIYLFL